MYFRNAPNHKHSEQCIIGEIVHRLIMQPIVENRTAIINCVAAVINVVFSGAISEYFKILQSVCPTRKVSISNATILRIVLVLIVLTSVCLNCMTNSRIVAFIHELVKNKNSSTSWINYGRRNLCEVCWSEAKQMSILILLFLKLYNKPLTTVRRTKGSLKKTLRHPNIELSSSEFVSSNLCCFSPNPALKYT